VTSILNWPELKQHPRMRDAVARLLAIAKTHDPEYTDPNWKELQKIESEK
jgi:hypothetical protein